MYIYLIVNGFIACEWLGIGLWISEIVATFFDLTLYFISKYFSPHKKRNFSLKCKFMHSVWNAGNTNS